ncbi:hypothetical protein BDV19DRAFT_158312 [Aspergillus venezuelensis]
MNTGWILIHVCSLTFHCPGTLPHFNPLISYLALSHLLPFCPVFHTISAFAPRLYSDGDRASSFDHCATEENPLANQCCSSTVLWECM